MSMQEAVTAAAAAVCTALQHPQEAHSAPAALQAVLPECVHVGVALTLDGGACRLSSGNLLRPPHQASLMTGPSLASTVCKDRKSKLLRQVAPHGGLEDVNAIVVLSGCGAIVCLPLLAPAARDTGAASCSTADAPCLGALTVGFASVANISSGALKGALLLAHALAKEQREPLQDLAALVASLLLPAGGAGGADADAGADSDGWASDLDHLGWDEGSEEGTPDEDASGRSGGRRARQHGRSRGGEPGGPPGAGGAAAEHSGVALALLAFPTRQQEAGFAAYHAAQMHRVDCYAYVICFAFFCLELFVPGTPFFLAKRMGWRALAGYSGIAPGLLLASKRTRGWFAKHRDAILAYTWAFSTLWQTAMSNYSHVLDRDTFRNPLYLQSYGWLTVVGLAFQMRFSFQVLAAPLAYAINTQLLPAICEAFFEDQPPRRCVAVGLLRIFLHGVALPLACCYVFETHARRLFLRSSAHRGSRVLRRAA